MWNLVIGGVFIVGGLSGRMALIGTNSGVGLAALGGALVLYGLYQMKSAAK